MTTKEFAQGIWNPNRESWRDVVEDYLLISRKRINNKLSMFKLQANILMDLIQNVQVLGLHKNELNKLKIEKENGKLSEKEYEHKARHINSEIVSYEFTNKALREIVDGIVWRYFNFNRAILYMLADKAPIESIKPDQGLIKSLYEFGEIFLEPDDFAILNDITNFLRVGDITRIDKDGNIELIEVKSSKKLRGGRIARQKQRMTELVEFFNTGIGEYDGNKAILVDSDIRQRNYLKMMLDCIKKARYRGYESTLIGNYLILEIVDVGKDFDFNQMKKYFKSKHKSVWERWRKSNDFVPRISFIEKLEFSRNYAPYSIYPFDVDICADILMGKILVFSFLNYSEIIRIFEKAGWKAVEFLFSKSTNELKEEVENTEPKDITLLKLRKSGCTINVPPAWFGSLCFELLSPRVLVEELDRKYIKGAGMDYNMELINYLDEKNIWK